MKIDGKCHCGNITYEAEIDPGKVLICHCTDCQTLSGSAFRTVAFTKSGSFKLLTGELKIYLKTAESGAERPQASCPDCGTPIYATSSGDGPKVHGLRTGAIRQRGSLAPQSRVWCQSEQPWTDTLASIQKTKKQPPMEKISK